MTTVDVGLEEARARLVVGAPVVVSSLPLRAARALAVAAAAGAPALPAFDAAVAAGDDVARREHAVRIASAQARAVTIGLALLPVVAVPGLSALTGMPLWRFYLTTPGVVVAVVGVSLGAVGFAIAARMVASVGRLRSRSSPAPTAIVVGAVVALVSSVVVAVPAAFVTWWWGSRRPERAQAPPGVDEVPELLATALVGGLSQSGALRLVAEHLPDHASDLRRAALAVELGHTPQLVDPLVAVLDVLVGAASWGAPAAPALRRMAQRLREEELTRVLAAAERLPALLTFPTALCLLPACLLLAGAPLLAEGLRVATASP